MLHVCQAEIALWEPVIYEKTSVETTSFYISQHLNCTQVYLKSKLHFQVNFEAHQVFLDSFLDRFILLYRRCHRLTLVICVQLRGGL